MSIPELLFICNYVNSMRATRLWSTTATGTIAGEEGAAVGRFSGGLRSVPVCGWLPRKNETETSASVWLLVSVCAVSGFRYVGPLFPLPEKLVAKINYCTKRMGRSFRDAELADCLLSLQLQATVYRLHKASQK
jgi:hypothetical protein